MDSIIERVLLKVERVYLEFLRVTDALFVDETSIADALLVEPGGDWITAGYA